jgi:hypothetical protein
MCRRSSSMWRLHGCELLVFATLSLFLTSCIRNTAEKRIRPETEDPRITYASGFLNTQPAVAFVGDQACAMCHDDIDATYHQHPMGRSSLWASKQDGGDPSMQKLPAYFNNAGFDFRVQESNGSIEHAVSFQKTKSVHVANYQCNADIAVGSGEQGRSFLSWEDGTLWQSPISWYTDTASWGLSPGFDIAIQGRRPITSRCAMCHLGNATPIPDTINSFEPSLMGLQANVSCEQCHGPGQLHVAKWDGSAKTSSAISDANGSPQQSTSFDTTIVNPKHLAPELKVAICQQCHLTAESEVEVRGRSLTEFRPGLPLNLFIAQYEAVGGKTEENRTVQHYASMLKSKCFVASQGQMDCTSCHNPHERPDAVQAIEYFRNRCNVCHESAPCTAEPESRSAQADNCVHCHMPRSTASSTAHGAVTNHLIVRDRSNPNGSRHATSSVGQSITMNPLTLGENRLSESDQQRNSDVALAMYVMKAKIPGQPFLTSENEINGLIQRLQKVMEYDPSDMECCIVLVSLLIETRDLGQAVQSMKSCLEKRPNHERGLEIFTSLAMRIGDADLAKQTATRMIAINSRSHEHFIKRATAHLMLNEFDQVTADAKSATKIYPLDPTPHLLRAVAAFGKGDKLLSENQLKTSIDLAIDDNKRYWVESFYNSQTARIRSKRP